MIKITLSRSDQTHAPSLTPTFTVSLTNIVEDLDGDGIEDPYDSDADGDGFSNQVELVNGSDPMDATSFNRAPKLTSMPQPLYPLRKTKRSAQ